MKNLLVVLGGAGTLPWLSEYRVRAARHLLEDTPHIDTVLLSGAKLRHMSQSDAEMMRDYLTGTLPRSRQQALKIIKDESSLSTSDQFQFLKRFLTKHKPTTIAVITSAFHIPRCIILQKRHLPGSDITFVPAESILPVPNQRFPLALKQLEKINTFLTQFELGEKLVKGVAYRSRA